MLPPLIVVTNDSCMKKFFAFVFVCALVSCMLKSCSKEKRENKEKEEKFARLTGSYDCLIQYEFWSVFNPCTDTTYNEKLDIYRKKDSIIILDFSYHIDQITEDRTLKKNSHNGFVIPTTVRFTNDSVYFSLRYGSAGHSVHYKYMGNKL